MVWEYYPASIVLLSTTTSCNCCDMTTDQKKRVTVFLAPGLLKHAKAQAIAEDVSLTALVERALSQYLPKETIIKKVRI